MNLFEARDSRCPKNPQRWWLFSWDGYHDVSKETTTVNRWGRRDWHQYEMIFTCKLCGTHLYRFGIDEAVLIRAGYTLAELP